MSQKIHILTQKTWREHHSSMSEWEVGKG